MLGGIPGLAVAVPSTPADAAGLTLGALAHEGPVVLLEHKLLSAFWLDMLAGPNRPGFSLDVPEDGMWGEVAETPEAVPLGQGSIKRHGADLLVVSIAVGVHRALQAAAVLAGVGIDAAVLDLRTVAPLDRDLLAASAVDKQGVLVVDEDYGPFGLSAEVAATLAERGITVPFARVAASGVIPYAPRLERLQMPEVARIVEAAETLLVS
jgi:pyruvate dehydrogenase E1 component beta subunit